MVIPSLLTATLLLLGHVPQRVVNLPSVEFAPPSVRTIDDGSYLTTQEVTWRVTMRDIAPGYFKPGAEGLRIDMPGYVSVLSAAIRATELPGEPSEERAPAASPEVVPVEVTREGEQVILVIAAARDATRVKLLDNSRGFSEVTLEMSVLLRDDSLADGTRMRGEYSLHASFLAEGLRELALPSATIVNEIMPSRLELLKSPR